MDDKGEKRLMMNRRGKISLPYVGFEPKVSAFKQQRPRPQTVGHLGPDKFCKYV
jgi:hypothetical protein